MDQIKTFLAVVKKHHFWILCGLACFVGLGMVYGATNKLSKAYDTKKSEISGVDQQISAHTSSPDHPNDTWVKAVQGKTESYRKRVYDAWGKLYAQQKSKVFIWPNDLGKEFVEAFDKDPAPVSANKMAALMELYQNEVTTTTLPAMAKIINAEWTIRADKEATERPRFAAGPRNRGLAPAPGADEAPLVEYPVVWDSGDQQRMYDAYTWDDPPRESEIRYAQEDMWVLKAIFDSIARANNGARIPNDAVVRTIQEAKIGYDAAEKFPLGEGANRIYRSRAQASVAVPLGMSGPATSDQSAPPTMFNAVRPTHGRRGPADSSGPGSRGRRGPAPAPSATDATAAADPDAVIKNGRYVNAKLRPLMATEWAEQMSPEYKLMAFRLVLVCDEARFQAVVAELANSVLPLEVREVRINPSGDSVNDRSSNRGRGPSGPRSGSAFSGGGGGSDAGTVMHNATIEIDGLAYLINPPDPKKIWTGELPAGIAAVNGAPTTGTATTSTTGTAATNTATTDNGSATAPAAPGATTATADAAAPPTNNDNTGVAPAADASADKGAAVTPRDGAAPKTDAAPTDAAAPPAK